MLTRASLLFLCAFALTAQAPIGPYADQDPRMAGIVSSTLTPKAPDKILWTYTGKRVDRSTLILLDPWAYFVDEDTLVCLNMTTGKTEWTHQAYDDPLSKAKDRDTSNPSDYLCAPAIQGDTLYISNNRAVLLALDRRTGQRKWQAALHSEPFGNRCGTKALATGGLVVVGTPSVRTFGGGNVCAFKESNGELLWTFEAKAALTHEPLLLEKRLVIGGGGWEYILKLETGALERALDAKPFGFPANSMRTYSLPQLVGKTLIFNEGNGPMGCLGKDEWQQGGFTPMDRPATGGSTMRGGWIGSVEDANKYSKQMLGRLFAFDWETGEQKWSYSTGCASSVFTSGSGVLICDTPKVVHLAASDGKKTWKSKEKSARFAALSEGSVFYVTDPTYFGSGTIPASKSKLISCRADNGDENFRTVVEGEASASPVIAGTSVLLAIYKPNESISQLTAVDSHSGKELWAFGLDGRINGHPFVNTAGILVAMDGKTLLCLK